MDNQQLAAIAGRFGTPCFVFDENRAGKAHACRAGDARAERRALLFD